MCAIRVLLSLSEQWKDGFICALRKDVNLSVTRTLDHHRLHLPFNSECNISHDFEHLLLPTVILQCHRELVSLHQLSEWTFEEELEQTHLILGSTIVLNMATGWTSVNSHIIAETKAFEQKVNCPLVFCRLLHLNVFNQIVSRVALADKRATN